MLDTSFRNFTSRPLPPEVNRFVCISASTYYCSEAYQQVKRSECMEILGDQVGEFLVRYLSGTSTTKVQEKMTAEWAFVLNLKKKLKNKTIITNTRQLTPTQIPYKPPPSILAFLFIILQN